MREAGLAGNRAARRQAPCEPGAEWAVVRVPFPLSMVMIFSASKNDEKNKPALPPINKTILSGPLGWALNRAMGPTDVPVCLVIDTEQSYIH